MRSMRRVTKKPPAILIEAINIAIPANRVIRNELVEICKIAPITIIPLIAFVTLISGVCKAGITFQITW